MSFSLSVNEPVISSVAGLFKLVLQPPYVAASAPEDLINPSGSGELMRDAEFISGRTDGGVINDRPRCNYNTRSLTDDMLFLRKHTIERDINGSGSKSPPTCAARKGTYVVVRIRKKPRTLQLLGRCQKKVFTT